MDVPFFKGRGACLPDPCFGVQAFHLLPGREADALAVGFGVHEQQVQMVVLRFMIELQDDAADGLPVLPDAVGDAFADAALNGPAGDNLKVFFRLIVLGPEVFHGAELERTLVVKDELFTVVVREKRQGDIAHAALSFAINNTRQQKATCQLFRAHPASYPTGGLQSFHFTIPYATAYCPPMTDIQFVVTIAH